MTVVPPGWIEAEIDELCVSSGTADPRLHPEVEFLYIDIGGVDGDRGEIVETKRLHG